jgi:tRNA(adenine34) deaminase
MLPTDAALAAMRTALRIAAEALETGDVPIGAVVLAPDGSVLATARNAREELGDPTAHAEVLALRAAAREFGDGWRLAGTTLVVTVEPWVSRLVFGSWEPRTGAVGSLWDVVRDRRLNHRPEVVAGVLADEAGELLVNFFRDQRVIKK